MTLFKAEYEKDKIYKRFLEMQLTRIALEQNLVANKST